MRLGRALLRGVSRCFLRRGPLPGQLELGGLELHSAIRFHRTGEVEESMNGQAVQGAADDTPIATSRASTQANAPDPQGQDLFARHQRCERDVLRLERELADAEEAYRVALDGPAGADVADFDGAAQNLADRERHIGAKKLELSRQRHLLERLGDALHPHQIAARGRLVSAISDQITEAEAQERVFSQQIAEHFEAVAGLERETQALEMRVNARARERETYQPRAARLLRVSVRTASPWKPPAGVLIKPSAWRGFVERAQQLNLEAADIIVNELTGAIVRSPVQDNPESHAGEHV